MRRSLRLLLATALTSGALMMLPGSATACDRQPCYTKCKVNGDYIDLEGGTIGNGRPIECYY